MAKGRWREWFRVTGPVLSVLFHVVLIFLLVTFVVIDRPVKEAEPIEVTYLEPSDIQDVLDELDEPPPEENELENPLTDNLMVQAEPDAVDQKSLDAALPSVQMEDVISPLKISLSQADMDSLNGRSQTAFGAATGAGGDLVGRLYDLKRTSSGKPREPNFAEDIRGILEQKFSKKAFRNFYLVPDPIYFNYLLMNYIPASEGPRAFGAEQYMQPSQFIVHYQGQIQVPASGQYRFVGEFDDILRVLIDGEVVLEAGWGKKVSNWEPRDYVGQHPCYTKKALVYGSWVNFSGAQPRRVDIIIGEEPGGYIGGLLMVQKNGTPYETEVNGRPVLPLFTVQPLTPRDRQMIASFSDWRFDSKPPPVMGRRRDVVVSSAEENDVSVIIR